MKEAVHEAVLWQRGQTEQEVKDARNVIEKEGHEIIELTKQQREIFSLTVASQYDDARKKFGEKMFNLKKIKN